MDLPIRPKKRRWLRWLLWPLAVLAFLVIGIPTLQAFVLRSRVLSAVRSAQSVRLEHVRLVDGTVLAKVELAGKQREKIAAAMPLLPDAGVPGLIAFCFVPRHRIVARASSGRETTFLVCFECDELGFDGVVSMTPLFWRSSLRRLFTGHGISVDKPDNEPDEKYKLSLRLRGSATGRA